MIVYTSGRHKSPRGAVAAQSQIALTLWADRREGVSRVTLCVRLDETQDVRRFPAHWTENRGHKEQYAACWTPEAPGLYWYWWELESISGFHRLGRDEDGQGRLDAVDDFQQTVYDGNMVIPSWMQQGVIYQIFPDRFYRGAGVEAPAGRRLHQSWREGPDYRPDSRGVIRNNDFFGGNLPGIREKLPYLKSLGVGTIYLNPIFLAPSNHRYDTSDYERIDPMLGTEQDFRELCQRAESLGIRVLLDGVFSHTGVASRYFSGTAECPGAAQSQSSPYYGWYRFTHWPDRYDCWWGIDTLPETQEDNESYLAYMTQGPQSVARRWLRAGASGWRLDVADELPDVFIYALRQGVKEEKPDAVVLGEVWEDASNKISYGKRRPYLLGRQLDSVMNYPFRQAVLAYLCRGQGEKVRQMTRQQQENYPLAIYYNLMNLLGTHDTPRLITLLAGPDGETMSRDGRAAFRLNGEERRRGVSRVKLASLLQYTLPGVPSLYYGDESAMEGYEDPFNRGAYPWGEENQQVLAWYRRLGQLRQECPELQRGRLIWHKARGDILLFERRLGPRRSCVLINAGSSPRWVRLPCWRGTLTDRLSGQSHPSVEGGRWLQIPSENGMLLQEYDHPHREER